MKSQKFIFKPSGRCGDIIYKNGEYEITIDWEMSGSPKSGILLAPLNLQKWDKPIGESIPRDEQHRLLNELRDWLKKKRIKSDISLPKVDTNSKEICSWSGCNHPVLKGTKICADHFDENLLHK